MQSVRPNASLSTEWLLNKSMALQLGYGMNLAANSKSIIEHVSANQDAKTLLHFISTLQKIGCPNASIIKYVLPMNYKDFANQNIKVDIFNLIKNIKNPGMGVTRCDEALSKDQPVGYIVHLTRRPYEWGANQELPNQFHYLRIKFAAKSAKAKPVTTSVEAESNKLPEQLTNDEYYKQRLPVSLPSLFIMMLDSQATYTKLVLLNKDYKTLYKQSVDDLLRLFGIYPDLLNTIFAYKSEDGNQFLTALHSAILSGSTMLALGLINMHADIHIHHVKFGYAYETAALYGDTSILDAMIEKHPDHSEMRQSIITHVCVRMFALTKNSSQALAKRAAEFMQLLEFLCRHYKNHYISACMKLNFGAFIGNEFKLALIGQAITKEKDTAKARNMLQHAEDKSHPFNFVLRLNESFLFELRSTAQRLKIERERLNARLEMDSQDELKPIQDTSQLEATSDEESPSPFSQQTNGDDDLINAIEMERRSNQRQPAM